MTARTFAEALEFTALGDEGFGNHCSPRLDRTLIWKYRTGRKSPRADTALNILKTLKRLGVVLTLEQLLAAPKENRAASRMTDAEYRARMEAALRRAGVSGEAIRRDAMDGDEEEAASR